MSHSELDSRRSNYLDAVHSCRISLATSNQFAYFIQQGHSVYRIHVQQKNWYTGTSKHMVQLKKSSPSRKKSSIVFVYISNIGGGRKQKNHPFLILEFRKRDIHYRPSPVSTRLKKKRGGGDIRFSGTVNANGLNAFLSPSR